MNHTHTIGIELGTGYVRGVLIRETITAARTRFAKAEVLASIGSKSQEPYDAAGLGPAIDDVLVGLGVTGQRLPAAVTIGPDFSGVGSGPVMKSWLVEQAKILAQPLVYSGRLGVAFARLAAIESATKLINETGLNLVRLDLAPMAVARILDPSSVKTFSFGSGQRWRAKLLDGAVLEAISSRDGRPNDRLQIIDSTNQKMELDPAKHVPAGNLQSFDAATLSRFAPSIGAVVGWLQDSDGDLLTSTIIDRPDPRQKLEHSRELTTPWGTRVEARTARTTLTLSRTQHPFVTKPKPLGYNPASRAAQVQTRFNLVGFLSMLAFMTLAVSVLAATMLLLAIQLF